MDVIGGLSLASSSAQCDHLPLRVSQNCVSSSSLSLSFGGDLGHINRLSHGPPRTEPLEGRRWSQASSTNYIFPSTSSTDLSMNTSRSCVEAMRPCHSVHVPNTAITPAGNSRYSMPLTYPYGVDVDQLLNVHTLDCQITSCETSLGGPLTATALSNRGNGSIASLLPQNEIGCKRAPNPVLGPSISRQTERVSSPVPGLHPYQVEYQTTGDQKDHPMHVDQTLRNWSAPGDCWRAGEAHEVARNTNIGGGRTSPRPVICEQRKEEAALGPYVDGAPEATNSDGKCLIMCGDIDVGIR